MGISIDEMKDAEKKGNTADSVKRIQWKKLVTELLEKERKFLSASEIRNSLGTNSHTYAQIYYLKKSGVLNMKVLAGKAYYGLKEW